MYRKIVAVEKWDRKGPALVLEVGKNGVDAIGEHQAMGPGDIWFYDVVMNDGS